MLPLQMMSRSASTGEPPAWKLYERLTAFILSEQRAASNTVTPNAWLIGHLSGVKRQVDVLIESRVGPDRSKRVVVDAKLHARPLDVKDVEEFEGMMRDVEADRGVLVCPSGFTAAAERRAQKAISLRLLNPQELDSITLSTWEPCASGECSVASTRKRRHKNGWVLFDEVFHVGLPDEPVAAVAIGKCDACSRFNVWCWECGGRFALEGDTAEATCGCSRLWLTSVESDGTLEDGTELTSVYLSVVMAYDRVPVLATVSRRPIN